MFGRVCGGRGEEEVRGQGHCCRLSLVFRRFKLIVCKRKLNFPARAHRPPRNDLSVNLFWIVRPCFVFPFFLYYIPNVAELSPSTTKVCVMMTTAIALLYWGLGSRVSLRRSVSVGHACSFCSFAVMCACPSIPPR